MKSRLFIAVVLAVLFALPAQSQNLKDSVVRCASVSLSYGFQLPGGDLAERFGPNSTVGAATFFKTRKNFFYGLQWSYLFGEQLRETGIFDSISTSGGFIIDKEGKFADVRIFERGFTLHASGGKIFNQFLSPNKNSGILLTGGVGYMQHKLRIYDNGARAPQLSKEYLKGYDRLTSGVMFSEFIGYWFMSESRYVNFFAGFEFYQGFTKSRRSWDYDLMRADTENRVDLLYGFRAGWVIPLYHRNTEKYSYY